MTNPQLATFPKDLRHSSSPACTISLSSSVNEPTVTTCFLWTTILLNLSSGPTARGRDLRRRYRSAALLRRLIVPGPEPTWLFCEIIEKWHVTAQTETTETLKTDCNYGAAHAMFSWRRRRVSRTLIMYGWCICPQARDWRADARGRGIASGTFFCCVRDSTEIKKSCWCLIRFGLIKLAASGGVFKQCTFVKLLPAKGN